MTRISIELIPRSLETLSKDIKIVEKAFPSFDLLNIPDLPRLSLRSHEACTLITQHKNVRVIPHVRAIDVAPGAPLPGANFANLEAVLVVAGDPLPGEVIRKVYPNSSVDVITRYRRELPHLDVYAVFDPYRRAPWEELEEIARKKDAGVTGFFTQPLFDLNMLAVCIDWLRDDRVFWGISPVIEKKTFEYWKRTNHIIFPRHYNFSLSANIIFAQKMINIIKEKNDDVYLMPLRVDLEEYLGELSKLLLNSM